MTVHAANDASIRDNAVVSKTAYTSPLLVEYGKLSDITLQVTIAGKGDNAGKNNSKTV